MSKALYILFGICLYWVSTLAQLPKVYKLNSSSNSSFLRTNTINDILVRQNSVWLGTESGLSLTVDGGNSWTNFSNTDDKGISAMAIDSNYIWIALGYSTNLNGESVQTGGGLQYSTDLGTTWTSLPQPIDHGTVDTLIYVPGNDTIRALDVTVPQQNITFDIALTKNTVWIASWAGMLRKSTDRGQTWTRVILPPDSLDSIKPTDSLNYAFDLSPASGRLGLRANNNHLVFSVYASDDSTIWVGTAGGINKSIDGGISWRKFNHINHSISGNFVVALKEQNYKNHRVMWAATVNANDPDEIKGVSYSEDAGETWKTTLLGEWAHNIAVNDSGNVVYIATDNGLFRSSDFGISWIKSGSIYDPIHQNFSALFLPSVTEQVLKAILFGSADLKELHILSTLYHPSNLVHCGIFSVLLNRSVMKNARMHFPILLLPQMNQFAFITVLVPHILERKKFQFASLIMRCSLSAL